MDGLYTSAVNASRIVVQVVGNHKSCLGLQKHDVPRQPQAKAVALAMISNRRTLPTMVAITVEL